MGNYLFVREEDGILILPPNRVYKLNKTGISLVRYLKQGGSFTDAGTPGSPFTGKESEIESFFRLLAGLCNNESETGQYLERIPFSFSFTQLPILGEIAVTYRCNNRCQFCYAGCSPENAPLSSSDTTPGGTGRHREMDTGEIKHIIDLFRNEANIPFFSFTGGEPTLRQDLEELAAYAVSLGLSVNLVSNGTLVDQARARSLYQAGLQTAQISIEGTTAELHDCLTGNPGSFGCTLDGIRALQQAGVSVQTNTTITTINAQDAVRMPAFLAQLGIQRFAMNLCIPSGTGLTNPDLFVGYDEIGPIVDQVRKAAFDAGLTFYWYSPTPFCLYNPIARGMGNKSCAAADGLISVSPSGDVLPCSSWQEPIGNLLDQSFHDIWFSSQAQWYKNKEFAPVTCKSCTSFTACQGACPLYWKACGTCLLDRTVRK
jgi:radical SAM protein with 4Fe4S-binding SPASM domain